MQQIHDSDDEFAYWDFDDLVARKITNNRPDLRNKIEKHDFPRPVTHVPGRSSRALYKVSEVKTWLRLHEQPRSEPPSINKVKSPGRPRGRPRKVQEHAAAE